MNTALPLLNAAPVDTPATTYTDINGLEALKKDPNSPTAIGAVAQQVEAMFLQMMLKSMRDADSANEVDGNEMSLYQDMFDKQIALTLSQHQDLGIGALLKRQIGGGGRKPGPAQIPASTSATTSATKTSSTLGAAPTPAEFVAQVMPTIRRAAAALGLNPLGLLAQAALETGWGQRMPRTADGSESRNMFGIKAGGEWSGERAIADSLEFNDGVAAQRRTAFRAYQSIDESIEDFANLLKSSPRYRDAIAAGGDAEAYVASIGRSGYATDPEYANKLNQILNSGTLRSALALRGTKL